MTAPLVAIDARLIERDATGDSTYWSGLVRGLMFLDSDLRYLLLSNQEKPASVPDHPRFSWEVVPSRRERWWTLFRFPLVARRHGARIFHTQYNMSPLIAKGGITTIHDVSFYIGPDWFQPKDRLILQRFVPSSARRASKVITVSESSKADVLKYISGLDGRVAVTPLASNPKLHAMDPQDAREVVFRDFGVDGPYLLTVGTRWPRKNMVLAVEAAECLPQRFPHRLLVTGKVGWGEEEAGARTQYTGYVTEDQLSALYSAADLYLAPSLYEGFGITILEAFTCGAPVLCSSGGSLPEVAGRAAVIEPTWDPMHWAETISNLLDDSGKLTAMRHSGIVRARKFTWEETARKTEQVYREVLAS